MNEQAPTIIVLGASGLIGASIATQLRRNGFPVIPVARRFNSAQKNEFGRFAIETPVVGLDSTALKNLLFEANPDIIVNCIGVLQDSSRGSVNDVHHGFVERLIAVLTQAHPTKMLVHLSIPGQGSEDRTPFSLTKRKADHIIATSPIPSIIIRPSFVVAPTAYGGSALIRALAALPIDLPAKESSVSFATTDMRDITHTVVFIAEKWRDGQRDWNEVWDVLAPDQTTLGDVIENFRHHLGGPTRRLSLSPWMINFGAKLGDFIARLGWSSPLRSTALEELRRGVAGNPDTWTTKTGIEPSTLDTALQDLPASVQEKWFARLYFAKPIVIGSLTLFWAVSGLIALTVAFDAANVILTSHGFPLLSAKIVTVMSSLINIGIGVAIVIRKTCRTGLIVGIAVSLIYMAGAAVITPEMWIEPLGALVKTVPAIVLMLVTLAILEDR